MNLSCFFIGVLTELLTFVFQNNFVTHKSSAFITFKAFFHGQQNGSGDNMDINMTY